MATCSPMTRQRKRCRWRKPANEDRPSPSLERPGWLLPKTDPARRVSLRNSAERAWSEGMWGHVSNVSLGRLRQEGAGTVVGTRFQRVRVSAGAGGACLRATAEFDTLET